jgi:hypothetical protein
MNQLKKPLEWSYGSTGCNVRVKFEILRLKCTNFLCSNQVQHPTHTTNPIFDLVRVDEENCTSSLGEDNFLLAFS